MDRSQALAEDTLHLYCPGGRDLPVEHLAALALLPIHDWNSELLKGMASGTVTSGNNISACVLAIDPFRRLGDLLAELKRSGLRWVTNFPSTEVVDGGMRATLDDLGFGLQKELRFVEDAASLGFGVAAFATTTRSASMMLESGAVALVTPDASSIDREKLASDAPVIEIAARRPG